MKATLTTCPYCGTGCNLYLLGDERGQLYGVEPVAGHPVSRGQLCLKGWNAHAFVAHPERLTHPLLRRQGKLRPCDWETALDLVHCRLAAIAERHGPDSLMFLASAKASNEENYLLMKLARAGFGTNNVDHCARLCHSSTVFGLAETLGSGAMTNSLNCFERTDLVLVIGSNTTEQHPLIGSRILQARQRGAGLIVIDGRTIRLARHADLHLRPQNGTDVALLCGMMRQILADGLEDRAFIAARCENFAAFEASLRDYTPERVAAITGVPAQQLVDAARRFACADKAMIVFAMGITQHSHGVDNVRALSNLALLTGNIGRPGTGLNPLRGQNNVQGACDMGALPDVYSGYQKVSDPAAREKFSAAWGVPLPDRPGLMATHAMEAAAAGRVRGMLIMGENPLLSEANQGLVRQALQKLEFLAVIDIFPTETAQLADVVLPAACYAERDGSFTSTERRVQRGRQAIAPPGEARADWQILCALLGRCGVPAGYAGPGEIMAEIAALTPSYAGISYPRLEGTGLQWPCPDAEHPGTPILHVGRCSRGKARFSPVAYRPAVETPDADYPFLLNTGRTGVHWHTGSMTRRSHLLDREEREPYVEIHPADAARYQLEERRPVRISSRRGSIEARTRITDRVPAGQLFIPFHFVEGAANALTNNALDPESGIPEFKVCAVRLQPC
ncbi:formate dehydrogenase major subunit/formate dehydrogenase alpha subunit [Geothermobacter ehrlichii]|uniref:nitrate reductase (cytochrome) n=1 Tax=Geothermobacter ehrlichii TaxID=213224 RepID=A0A5D3WH67_9BACT|nr:formate dehydrogenase subunit alpha [Geothermobacter ehrlichii]TYO96655.1 formate dehydrogenase major subunit/formate dehydrogenase alpha subunit [Geothermobacter ehrlichii]